MFFAYIAKKVIEIIAFKVDGFLAALTDKQMLMSLCVGKIGITAMFLMDTLYQMKLFKFFERAINGYQTQFGIAFLPQVVDFGGC